MLLLLLFHVRTKRRNRHELKWFMEVLKCWTTRPWAAAKVQSVVEGEETDGTAFKSPVPYFAIAGAPISQRATEPGTE